MKKSSSGKNKDIFKEIQDWAEKNSVSQEELQAWFELLRSLTTPGSTYDAVFHTEVRRLSRLVILLINHLFGTKYTGNERVSYGATEQPVRMPGGLYVMRRADSHFTIDDENGCRHVYHVECQTADDGTIVLRVAEYDFVLALDHVQKAGDSVEIPLPESAIVYLRQPSEERLNPSYRITDAEGRFVEQNIRTVVVQDHTISDLFALQLFALLPFYLFTHSKTDLLELENSPEGRGQLLNEAEGFVQKILAEDDLLETEKSQLLELTQKVTQALIKNNTLKQKMESTMNTTIIPLSTDKIFDEAEARAMKAAKGRIDEAEARATKAEARATKAEADIAAERSKAEADIAAERSKAEADIAAERSKAKADIAAERSRAEAKVAESIRQMLKDQVPAENIISWLGVSEKQLEAVQRESAYS